jgi:predicted transcriptional regulator
MLTELLRTLKERGPMSLKELSVACGSDLSATEGMLQMLVSKGRIILLETKCSKCKGCIEVKREDALIYKIS